MIRVTREMMSTVKKFVVEDGLAVQDDLYNDGIRLNFDNYTVLDTGVNENSTEYVDIEFNFSTSDGFKDSIYVTYVTDPEDEEKIYVDTSVDEMRSQVEDDYKAWAASSENDSIYSSVNISAASYISAAGEDEEDFDDEDLIDDEDSISDQLEDLSDDLEDIQDDMNDVEEDNVNIDMNNNIEGHYIAECDRCHGVFISAVSESDQVVEKISGICPLCDEESDQYLKWVIRPANNSEVPVI